MMALVGGLKKDASNRKFLKYATLPIALHVTNCYVISLI